MRLLLSFTFDMFIKCFSTLNNKNLSKKSSLLRESTLFLIRPFLFQLKKGKK